MNKLTKLDALSKLASAWHYLLEDNGSDPSGAETLHDKFHHIRRSLRIGDLKPVKCNEGWNGKGPTQL